jgi:hypothetical protein
VLYQLSYLGDGKENSTAPPKKVGLLEMKSSEDYTNEHDKKVENVDDEI